MQEDERLIQARKNDTLTSIPHGDETSAQNDMSGMLALNVADCRSVLTPDFRT